MKNMRTQTIHGGEKIKDFSQKVYMWCKTCVDEIQRQKKLAFILLKILFYVICVLAIIYSCRHWEVLRSQTLLLAGIFSVLALWDIGLTLVTTKNKIQQYEIRYISIREITMIFCNSIVLMWATELLCNQNFVQMTWKNFGFNIVITFVISVFIVFTCNSLAIGMTISNLFFWFWMLASYYVLQLRGTPLQFSDVQAVGTAMDVMDGYKLALTDRIVFLTIMIFCWIIYYMQHWDYRFAKNLSKRILVHILGIVFCIGGCQAFMHSDLMKRLEISLYYWEPAVTYETYGNVTAFLSFAQDLTIDTPQYYSESYIERIVESSVKQYKERNEYRDVKKQTVPTNIIVIMNESLADYTVYPNVHLDQDYLSFYHSLGKNTIKGNCYVSTYGGGTDCAEYEFLTGNSMEFKPGVQPYCGLFNQDCFSIVSAMKQQGYYTVAAHAANEKNWNRGTIYNYFGFDQFLTLDDFKSLKKDKSLKGPYKTRQYISDQCDLRRMEQIVEQKEDGEPLFIFNITIQNHAAYNNEKYQSTVHLLDYEGSNKAEVEQYLSLAKSSDDALKDFVEYFEKVDEPTMICMFGDHHPDLTAEFWDYAMGTDYDADPFIKLQLRYQTPYMIWTNYDMPSAVNQDISTNYLGSYLMELAGLSLTPYNQFLLNMKEEIPAMNVMGYVDKNGNNYSYEEEGRVMEWLQQYNAVIYNGLAVDSGTGALYQVENNGD